MINGAQNKRFKDQQVKQKECVNIVSNEERELQFKIGGLSNDALSMRSRTMHRCKEWEITNIYFFIKGKVTFAAVDVNQQNDKEPNFTSYHHDRIINTRKGKIIEKVKNKKCRAFQLFISGCLYVNSTFFH